MLRESALRRAQSASAHSEAAPAAEAELSPEPKISCIVCAYNEADRIRHILSAVHRHPALLEVIVVNDGSTDETPTLLCGYPNIKLISYNPTRGKTYAMGQGIAAARGEYIMLLDADLSGVTAADIQALADPVIDGRAEVSISLRRNSLALYRGLGLDFVSGERVLPAAMIKAEVAAMAALPRWGGEAFINNLIIRDPAVDRGGRLAGGVQHPQVQQGRPDPRRDRRACDDRRRLQGALALGDGAPEPVAAEAGQARQAQGLV